MYKFLTLLFLAVAISAGAYEATLSTDAILVVPAVVPITGVANRQPDTLYSNGTTIAMAGKLFVCATTGTSDTALQTNDVVTTDTSKLTVSGIEAAGVNGTYNRVQANGYTNAGYTISVSAGEYRLTTNTLVGTATTNRWYSPTIVGNYTNSTGVSGNATVAYGVITNKVYVPILPELSTSGLTTDGTVEWLPVLDRRNVIVSVLEGDAVLGDRNGNKIYTSDRIELQGFKQALWGTSTNAAKISIFTY